MDFDGDGDADVDGDVDGDNEVDGDLQRPVVSCLYSSIQFTSTAQIVLSAAQYKQVLRMTVMVSCECDMGNVTRNGCPANIISAYVILGTDMDDARHNSVQPIHD
jgi:hypothetical protein